MIDRRGILKAGLATATAFWLPGCSDSDSDAEPNRSDQAETSTTPARPTRALSLRMPAEEAPHDATWMCLPARDDVWGIDLLDVQTTIAEIALAIAEFEPVRMLVRPGDRALAVDLMGSDVDLYDAPVDDLWARDTLPLFLTSDDGDLAAARVQFNGWGGKQVHSGDATLAALVAEIVGADLYDTGLVGEGGGLETDGDGTVLAARSSWVNDNRNPGLDERAIGDVLAGALGAERVLWVDGLAGQDITDGHIDTLARFVDPATIIHEVPSYVEPGEVWYDLATTTADELATFSRLDGQPYDLVTLEQPATTRRDDPEFLASYVNYYVCNGAVLVPQFGDAMADGRAAELIGDHYPGRAIVALDIDPVSAGGGGIHCATQQQPTA